MKEARYFRGLTASAHTRTHIRLPKWDVTKLEPRRQEGFNIAEGKSGSWNSEKRRSFSEYLIWIAAQDMTITLDSVSKLVTQMLRLALLVHPAIFTQTMWEPQRHEPAIYHSDATHLW